MTNWNDILHQAQNGNFEPPRRDERSDDDWRAILSPEQFAIMRQAATERAFSSELCSLFAPGIYGCGCCREPLFDARTKFDSGTGWPSFTQALADNVIAYKMDYSIKDRTRVEAICAICDAHLGHVFPDGPPPSGLRYCMNALALVKMD